jgi:hypothetical protein
MGMCEVFLFLSNNGQIVNPNNSHKGTIKKLPFVIGVLKTDRITPEQERVRVRMKDFKVQLWDKKKGKFHYTTLKKTNHDQLLVCIRSKIHKSKTISRTEATNLVQAIRDIRLVDDTISEVPLD